MKSVIFAVRAACLICLLGIQSSFAEDVVSAPVDEADGGLTGQFFGYWVVDLDSEATKAMLKTLGDDEELLEGIRKQVALVTYEFKEGEMVIFEQGAANREKFTIAAEDAEKRTLTIDYPDGPPVTMTLDGDRMAMHGTDLLGEEMSLGFKRIGREEFEKRVPEGLREGNEDGASGEVEGDYPTAEPVPGNPGFVFSPYNRKLIDVRGLPSGALVRDPHFPANENKIFRAP